MCPCGASWTGTKLEHCTARGCHQSFGTTWAGDHHRVGSPGTGDQRCMTTDEMTAAGMVSKLNNQGSVVWYRGSAGYRSGVAPENPFKTKVRHESGGLAGSGEGQYLTLTPQALESAESDEEDVA